MVAACLLLGDGRLEPALAGAAAAFGLGAKLTTGLVLPILVWLALARGRRDARAGASPAALVGFVGDRHVGLRAQRRPHRATCSAPAPAPSRTAPRPSYPRSVANAFYLLYGMMDASVLSSRLIHVLAIAGVVIGLAVGVRVRRAPGPAARRSPRARASRFRSSRRCS